MGGTYHDSWSGCFVANGFNQRCRLDLVGYAHDRQALDRVCRKSLDLWPLSQTLSETFGQNWASSTKFRTKFPTKHFSRLWRREKGGNRQSTQAGHGNYSTKRAGAPANW